MPNITNLSAPVLGDDKDTYSTKISDTFTAIDNHDHSSGKGKQVITAGITDAAVTNAKLAANAVDTTKILDSAVTTAKLLDSAVTTAKLSDGNVTEGKLAAGVGTPVGGVIAFAGASAPTGWLVCTGAAISRVTYASLFAVLGITHGQGDGSTTFNLPDYRGRFLRGVDSATARDPNAATRTAMATGGNAGDNVGSVQTSDFGSHDHTGATGVNSANHTHDMHLFQSSPGPSSNVIGDTSSIFSGDSITSTGESVNHVHAIPAVGGSETRPINAYVSYIIKT